MAAHLLATPLRSLHLLPVELNLAVVLKSGQSFRWHRFESAIATQHDGIKGDEKPIVIGQEEYAMAWKDRTIVLRQDATRIYYRSLYPNSSYQSQAAYLADVSSDTTLPLLRNYFQLDTSLQPLYSGWALADPHFKRKLETEGERLRGIRVLAQDPWETLMSFVCSSNNHISRITGMVNSLCSTLGQPMPHPTSFSPETLIHPSAFPLPLITTPVAQIPIPSLALHSFPPPSSLTPESTDALLRSLGFGYRAPFIQATAALLVEKAAEARLSTDEYLETLREGNLEGGLAECRRQLMLFKGVGRKVADCVSLFGLGWKEVVPVDTHVFQIAIRDYSFPSTKTTALTPILHDRVASLLQQKWGSHSGWAQQVLFFADLKVASPSPKKGSPRKKSEVVKGKWEIEVDELMKTPSKRRRDESPLGKRVKKEEDSPSRVVPATA